MSDNYLENIRTKWDFVKSIEKDIRLQQTHLNHSVDQSEKAHGYEYLGNQADIGINHLEYVIDELEEWKATGDITDPLDLAFFIEVFGDASSKLEKFHDWSDKFYGEAGKIATEYDDVDQFSY